MKENALVPLSQTDASTLNIIGFSPQDGTNESLKIVEAIPSSCTSRAKHLSMPLEFFLHHYFHPMDQMTASHLAAWSVISPKTRTCELNWESSDLPAKWETN